MVLETNDTDTSYTEKLPQLDMINLKNLKKATYLSFNSPGQSPQMKSLKQETVSCLGVNATEASYQKGKS